MSAEVVAEIDGNQVMVSLPRDQIASMTLHHGIKSERPIIDITIGVIFIFIGIYIFFPMLSSLVSAIFLGPIVPRYNASKFVSMGLVFVPIGIYFIADVIRKRYFLLITTKRGDKRKIVFNSDISYTELRSFIDQAKMKYGYEISAILPEE